MFAEEAVDGGPVIDDASEDAIVQPAVCQGRDQRMAIPELIAICRAAA